MVGRRVAFLVACALGIFASCQDATQAVIEARTNVAHRAGIVTSFTIGPPDQIERAEPTTETSNPWGDDGFVGSLVTVPGGDKDAPFGVKLVLGVRRAARECLPPKYEGCIVARRKLRYIPHERLRLPIALYAQCEGVPCDEDSTCNALGTCVPATIDPNACTSPDGCTIPGDLPPGSVTPDAAPPIDAATDVATTDAPSEASTDAGVDAPAGDAGQGTPNVVDCPGAANDQCQLDAGKCCWNVSVMKGMCIGGCTPSASDDAGSKLIQCDDDSDCASQGAGYKCCSPKVSGVTVCQSNCEPAVAYDSVCHGSGNCPAGKTCTKIVWLHYRICQ